jgi:hypothetical protein
MARDSSLGMLDSDFSEDCEQSLKNFLQNALDSMLAFGMFHDLYESQGPPSFENCKEKENELEHRCAAPS